MFAPLSGGAAPFRALEATPGQPRREREYTAFQLTDAANMPFGTWWPGSGSGGTFRAVESSVGNAPVCGTLKRSGSLSGGTAESAPGGNSSAVTPCAESRLSWRLSLCCGLSREAAVRFYATEETLLQPRRVRESRLLWFGCVLHLSRGAAGRTRAAEETPTQPHLVRESRLSWRLGAHRRRLRGAAVGL